MKKLFALLLALCLLGSFAMAETTEVTEVNWADVEGAASEVGGQFVTVEALSMAFWLPEGFVQSELTEDQEAMGFFAIFNAEDNSGRIGMQFIEADGADVMDVIGEIEGASDAEPMLVNGLSCVNFDMKDMDATCLAFGTQNGNILVITFAPMSNEDFAAKAMLVVASIQSAE